jgi:4-aminobutyrate aminotransferase
MSYQGMWCDPYSGENSDRIIEYLEYVFEKEKNVGALIAEAIRNTTVHVPRPNFWKNVKEICKRNGVLLIFDEIATCLFRTGKMYAFEHFDVVPDMITVGKGFGAGIIPMAALLVKETVDSFQNDSIGHFTFEKNPLGATAALASLEYIEKEKIPEHVKQCEELIHRRLKKLKKEYPLIGDIRGIGMLWAIELVKDQVTKEPAIQQAERVMYNCLGRGLNFKVSSGNILTLSPPLIITKSELNDSIDIISDAIMAENKSLNNK